MTARKQKPQPAQEKQMKDVMDASLSVPFSMLCVARENPRSFDSLDFDKIKELAENIRIHGMFNPLIVYEEDELFHITAGQRRFQALTMLVAEGTMPVVEPIPVTVMEKDEAVNAGVSDNFTHVKMDEIDELKVFADPQHKDRSDSFLAALVGRSARYVAQRRKLLELPQPYLGHLLTGILTLSQATGLTLCLGQPGLLEEAIETFRHRDDWDEDNVRHWLNRRRVIWDEHRFSEHVSQDEYKAAGGTFQSDLFSEDLVVEQPELVTTLAIANYEQRVKLQAELDGYGWVTRITDPKQQLWNWKGHDGINSMTPEERAEWTQIRYSSYRLTAELEQAEDEAEDMEGTEEGEGPVKAAQAALEAWEARYEALKTKAEKIYPPELKALLGVVWKSCEANTYGPAFEIAYPKLPEDLEPLYEGGWLERPVHAEGDSGVTPVGEKPKLTPEEKLATPSQALQLDIGRIRLHALRMTLASWPDLVLNLYAVHLHPKKHEPMLCFESTPNEVHSVLPEMECKTSKAWDKLVELHGACDGNAEAIRDLSPLDTRKLLAYRILRCSTPFLLDRVLTVDRVATVDRVITVDRRITATGDIRLYWTPSGEFLQRYSPAQLGKMITDLGHEVMKGTRVQMAQQLHKLVAKRKDWLPIGFVP